MIFALHPVDGCLILSKYIYLQYYGMGWGSNLPYMLSNISPLSAVSRVNIVGNMSSISFSFHGHQGHNIFWKQKVSFKCSLHYSLV